MEQESRAGGVSPELACYRPWSAPLSGANRIPTPSGTIMRLTGEFVYCAAIGHRQIVKLADAELIDDGRYVCRTCRQRGHVTMEVGQRQSTLSAPISKC